MATGQIDSMYMTLQEELCAGSSRKGDKLDVPKYTPRVLYDGSGKQTVDSVNKERKSKKSFNAYSETSDGILYDLKLSLEPLDTAEPSETYGQTISDPRILSATNFDTNETLSIEDLTVEKLEFKMPFSRRFLD